jgi:hypothetical protein
MANSQVSGSETGSIGRELSRPRDFTDPEQMLGASSALLEGKILRGGMGSGMPYWGTIFANEEVKVLVDYLWTFQFPIVADE